MLVALICLWFWSVTASTNCHDGVCEFVFVVKDAKTMSFEGCDLFEKGGVLFCDGQSLSDEQAATVLVVGGVKRDVTTVNGTVPGPTVRVTENDLVRVTVINELSEDIQPEDAAGTSVHFHGIYQTGTPWYDGVPMVTQCLIETGSSFTYEFVASPAGTHWWHSHAFWQSNDGMFGAFIVEPLQDVFEDLYDEEHVMIVSDWFSEPAADYTYHGRGAMTYSWDGAAIAVLPFEHGLINGQGTNNQIFEVKGGKRYRFRVVNSGMVFAFQISVDEHTLTVISADGHDIQPQETEYFIIHVGERFDFILKTDQDPNEYYIRVQTLEEEPNEFFAILSYSDTIPNDELILDGSSRPCCDSERICTTEKPSRVVNCPWERYYYDDTFVCINLADLKNFNDFVDVPVLDEDSIEMVINFQVIGGNMSANSILYEDPVDQIPLFQKDSKFEGQCRFEDGVYPECDGFQIEGNDDQHTCMCTHTADIPYHEDGTISMTFISQHFEKNGEPHVSHPIHLHGHAFYVVAQGFAAYNETSKFYDPIPAIKCGDINNCYDGTWDSEGYPATNEKNPIQKDTITVPPGSYAIVRIRRDNIGSWFTHCHLSPHTQFGMGFILNIGLDQMNYLDGFGKLIPPADFSSSCDASYAPSHTNGENIVMIILIIVTLFVLVTIAVIIYRKWIRRKRQTEPTETTRLLQKKSASFDNLH